MNTIPLQTFFHQGRYYTHADGFGVWGDGPTTEESVRVCISNLKAIEPRTRAISLRN